MTENVQLKYLCNDIAIVYQTLGTRDAFMYSCSRQASNGDQRMHNVVVANNSRFTFDSDSDDDNVPQRACGPSSIQRACGPSSIQRACAPSNYDDDDDDDDDVPQRACGPSSIQRACAPSNDDDDVPSNNDDDIDNFCITDETPFSSENVNTILKSFAKV